VVGTVTYEVDQSTQPAAALVVVVSHPSLPAMARLTKMEHKRPAILSLMMSILEIQKMCNE